MSLNEVFRFFMSCIHGISNIFKYFEPETYVEVYELENLIPEVAKEPESTGLRARSDQRVNIDVELNRALDTMEFMNKSLPSPIKEASDDEFVMVDDEVKSPPRQSYM